MGWGAPGGAMRRVLQASCACVDASSKRTPELAIEAAATHLLHQTSSKLGREHLLHALLLGAGGIVLRVVSHVAGDGDRLSHGARGVSA